jgi:hypothetical protein
MRETGTVLVGDISNSLVSPSVLIAGGIGGVVFHELLGFAQADVVAAVRDAWVRVEAQPAWSSVFRGRARAVLRVAGVVRGDRPPRRRRAAECAPG